jgi:hypothetical protein
VVVKKKAKKTKPATKAKKTRTKAKKANRAKSAVEGEGSYTAARNYDRKTESFVAKNKSRITKMAKDAEAALEGPEGKTLRAAEMAGKSKARR